MKRFRLLLLLDANVVIHLFRLGIWERVVEACGVHLARTVVEVEAQFYETDDDEKRYFDVGTFVRTGSIAVFDILPSQLTDFRRRFDATYFERLDPGETESLAYLLAQTEECRICSGDASVIRTALKLLTSKRWAAMKPSFSMRLLKLV